MSDPLVSEDIDLRDFAFMPLDVLRLRDSELSATPDAEAFRCCVLSWCVSWHQVPAGSLPDDDATLARLLGFGRDIKGWKKVRAADGLRGWVKCSDGRLYHPVVAEKAKEAWTAKLAQRARTEAARKAREEARQKQLLAMSHNNDMSVTDTVTSSNGQGQGQGQGQGLESRESVSPEASPPAKPSATATRGCRLPEDWVLPKAWGEWALQERPTWGDAYIRMVADKFKDHWRSQPGRDGTKADWEATWRNWVRREPDPKPGHGGGDSSSNRPWFMSWSGIEEKAKELGLVQEDGEAAPYFKQRVYDAANVTEEMVRKAKIDLGERV